jgi:hypothetical protein
MPRFLQSSLIAAACGLACAWAAFLLAGHRAASAIAGKFSGILLRAADGKFDDPAGFVHGRLAEVLTLATLAVVLFFATVLFGRWLDGRSRWRHARGLILGVAGFGFINLLAWACGRTVLFWVPFYDKVRVDNFAQYHIKRTLFEEVHGKRRVVLMGSSQANRAIDEVLMNREMGRSIWTTELSQPGARGFDMLTLSRDIPLERGDVVVCYLSEIMFYGEGSGIVAADFLNFSEIPDASDLGGWNFFAPGSVSSGLLGRVLPIYRFRESFSHRILGWPIVNLEQVCFDHSLEQNLQQQAERRAPGLGVGPTSTFEKAAFGRMIGELAAKGCTTVVIAGHTHPFMRQRLNPDVTSDLAGFLQELVTRHPAGMRLIDAADFFQPGTGDFMDLVHFNDEAQRRFTLALIKRLELDFPGASHAGPRH